MRHTDERDAFDRYGATMSGYLYALDSASDAWGSPFIAFPALPDEIDFTRENSFDVVVNQLYPDGIHIYRGTQPLEIPMSFVLHAYDYDYCNGPHGLVEIASKLHSLALPLSRGGEAKDTSVPTAQDEKKKDEDGEADPDEAVDEAVDEAGQSVESKDKSSPDDNVTVAQSNRNRLETSSRISKSIGAEGNVPTWPPVCVMRLMVSGQRGVHCIGYLKRVSVKFKGPWLNEKPKDAGRDYATSEELRGRKPGQNLPTALEASFTFVHAPGYRNKFSVDDDSAYYDERIGVFNQTFGEYVHDHFYDTIDVSTGGGAVSIRTVKDRRVAVKDENGKILYTYSDQSSQIRGERARQATQNGG